MESSQLIFALPLVHWWFSFNLQRRFPWTPVLGLSKNGAGVLLMFDPVPDHSNRHDEASTWSLHQAKMAGCQGGFCFPATDLWISQERAGGDLFGPINDLKLTEKRRTLMYGHWGPAAMDVQMDGIRSFRSSPNLSRSWLNATLKSERTWVGGQCMLAPPALNPALRGCVWTSRATTIWVSVVWTSGEAWEMSWSESESESWVMSHVWGFGFFLMEVKSSWLMVFFSKQSPWCMRQAHFGGSKSNIRRAQLWVSHGFIMLNPLSPTFNTFWIIKLSVVRAVAPHFLARFCTPAARRAVRELGWSSCGTRWEPRGSAKSCHFGHDWIGGWRMLGVDALKIIPRYHKWFKVFFFSLMVFAVNPWWKPLQSESNFSFCMCRGTEGGTKVGLGLSFLGLAMGSLGKWFP